MQKGKPAKSAAKKTGPSVSSGRFLVDADITRRLMEKGVTQDEVFSLVVPRRTLDRRKAEGGMLSAEESDRAIRLQRISEHADRVFGDPNKARRWLHKANRALEGETPMNLLVSESGAHLVHEVLHRIEFGMYS